MGCNLGILSAVNSFLRTLLAMIVVGAVGLWYGYRTYHNNTLALRRKQDDLDATQARLQGQNERTSRLKGELVEKNQRIEEKNREIATLSREMENLETKMPLRNYAGQRWFTASCLRQGG